MVEVLAGVVVERAVHRQFQVATPKRQRRGYDKKVFAHLIIWFRGVRTIARRSKWSEHV